MGIHTHTHGGREGEEVVWLVIHHFHGGGGGVVVGRRSKDFVIGLDHRVSRQEESRTVGVTGSRDERRVCVCVWELGGGGGASRGREESERERKRR